MRQVRTSLALPAVTAGIALLAATAIAVGITTSPSTDPAPAAAAAAAPMGAGQMMSGMTMPAVGAPVAAQQAPVATDSITIQNFAFAPATATATATATVKAGTTVTWTNRDQDAHTVSAMSGPFHSPTLTTGQSYRYTFPTPGHYDYLCTIHPFMTAAVVVTRGD